MSGYAANSCAPRLSVWPPRPPLDPSFVSDLQPAHGVRARVGRVFRQQLSASLARRLAQPLPSAVPSDRELLGAALELLPEDRATRGHVIVADVHDPERQRLLAFALDDDGRPQTVLKAAASAAGRATIRAEAEALLRLGRSRRLQRSARAPRVLGFTEGADMTALRLSGLNGPSQYAQLHSGLFPAGNIESHLLQACRWLITFQDATICDSQDGELPAAAAHGDFWPGNVLALRDGVGVVDWERFWPAAPVTQDLFHYLISYAFVLPSLACRRREPAAALHAAFVANGPLGRATRLAVDMFGSARGIPRRRIWRALAAQLRCPSAVPELRLRDAELLANAIVGGRA